MGDFDAAMQVFGAGLSLSRYELRTQGLDLGFRVGFVGYIGFRRFRIQGFRGVFNTRLLAITRQGLTT